MYKRRERKNKRDGLTADDPGLAAASAASAASEPENVPLALRLWQWQWELTSITSIQCSTTPSLTTVPSLTWLFSLLAFADTLENLFINYISGLD